MVGDDDDPLLPPMGPPLYALYCVFTFFFLMLAVTFGLSPLLKKMPRADTWLWAADVTTTSFQLRVKGSGFLVVDPAAGGERTFAKKLDQLPPWEVHSLFIDNLVPGTEYVYGLASSSFASPTSATMGRVKTWLVDCQPVLRVATGGCASTGTKSAAFTEIAKRRYDLIIHMGDLHYSDINVNDSALFKDAIDIVHGSDAYRRMFQSAPVYYMWDDHDYGANNANALSPSRQASMQTFKEYVPHPSVRHDRIWYGFSIGRSRFLMLDTRSEAVPGKQLVSDAQLEWLLDEIANPGQHRLLVLVLCQPWIGEEDTDADADGWTGDIKTRKLVAEAIAQGKANGGYQNVLGLASDSHSLAFDDGSNSDYSDTGGAGFPLVQAGPFAQEASCKGGPYTSGCYGIVAQMNNQWGSLEIKDDGSEDADAICVDFALHSAAQSKPLYEKVMCGPLLGTRNTGGEEGGLSILTAESIVIIVIWVVLIARLVCSTVSLCRMPRRWQNTSFAFFLPSGYTFFFGIMTGFFWTNQNSGRECPPLWQPLLVLLVLLSAFVAAGEVVLRFKEKDCDSSNESWVKAEGDADGSDSSSDIGAEACVHQSEDGGFHSTAKPLETVSDSAGRS